MSSNDRNDENVPQEIEEEQATSSEEDEQAPEPGKKRVSFDDMGLSEDVLKGVKALGFTDAMEVQKVTYPEILKGRDLMVQSRTGSGKTAAFGIPMAQQLVDPEESSVQSLILCPTRELARQVSKEVEALCKFRSIEVLPVYGGAPIGPQIKALKKGVQVVAGTPGRVLDHLRRKTLVADRISMLVLDECDEMLSMGFQEEIQAILDFMPEDRQTLLFSATVTDDIARLARRYMREPEKISLSDDFIGVKEVDHYYYMTTSAALHQELARVLEKEAPGSAIIFCNTRESTNVVSRFLRKKGYKAEAISSDLSQKERDRVMEKMRKGKIQFLVATDVAARGIDIQDLTHVFNYGFPDSAEVYVHRTGRTGRAGKGGVAISLVSPQDIGNFYYMKLTYGIEPTEKRLPTEQELLTNRESERFTKVTRVFSQEAQPDYASLARRLWHSHHGERVFANMLQEFFETSSKQRPSTARRSGPPRQREGRRDRDRPAKEEQRDTGKTKKLYVNIGRKDGLKVHSLRDLLVELSGVDPDALKKIRMRETHSFIKLDAEPADQLMAQANGKRFQEKTLIVEPARK